MCMCLPICNTLTIWNHMQTWAVASFRKSIEGSCFPFPFWTLFRSFQFVEWQGSRMKCSVKESAWTFLFLFRFLPFWLSFWVPGYSYKWLGKPQTAPEDTENDPDAIWLHMLQFRLLSPLIDFGFPTSSLQTCTGMEQAHVLLTCILIHTHTVP